MINENTTVKVWHDDQVESPREWDNFRFKVCFYTGGFTPFDDLQTAIDFLYKMGWSNCYIEDTRPESFYKFTTYKPESAFSALVGTQHKERPEV